jgi:hypothetical protein
MLWSSLIVLHTGEWFWQDNWKFNFIHQCQYSLMPVMMAANCQLCTLEVNVKIFGMLKQVADSFASTKIK